MSTHGGRASVRPPQMPSIGVGASAATEVSRCGEADMAHVYDLALRAYGELPGWGRRRVVELLLDDAVFVARAAGRAIGYVAVGREAADALVVDQLLVSAGHERSDVGDLLLAEAERFGAAERARTLRVVVGENDWPARGFYRRHGFAPVARGVFELPLPEPR